MLASADNTMLLAGMSIFINPPPISNRSFKFDIYRKTPFSSPGTLSLKESEVGYRRSLRFKNKISDGLIETGLGGSCSGEPMSPAVSALEQEALIQTVGGLHTLVNHLSKRIMILTYTGFILLRHDAFTFWAALGCFSNFILSFTLKRCLKQERPVSGLSSSPGMPSSHAQTLFYTAVLLILSSVKCRGLNGVTVILGVLLVTLGSYFSWLRVSQGYHTLSQVIVGAVVGCVFSTIWFKAWEEIVHNAYKSNLWVRILVVGGVACTYLGFFFYAIRKMLNGED